MTSSLPRRVQHLEEKFAFQEQTLDALNDVLIDQQNQISALQDKIRKLQALVHSSQLTPEQDQDPPPPHY